MKRLQIFQAVPVLQVADVAASMDWYQTALGFESDPFPAEPPYAFAILSHGETELMLQRACEPQSRTPARYRWDVYLRLAGEQLPKLCSTLEPTHCVQRTIERMPYGLCEMEVVDPDGYVICLAEPLRNDRQYPTPREGS
ncbi:MAG: VOC family protein [Pirellula sp.]